MPRGGSVMVATYAASGGSFRADKPKLWSPGQFTDFGAGNFAFDLYPDGRGFAVLKAPGTEENASVTHVSLVLNCFEELQRRVPAGTK